MDITCRFAVCFFGWLFPHLSGPTLSDRCCRRNHRSDLNDLDIHRNTKKMDSELTLKSYTASIFTNSFVLKSHAMIKKNLTGLFLVCLQTLSAQDTTQQIMPGRQNAAHQLDKPYVILISADGFRSDFAVKYNFYNLLLL